MTNCQNINHAILIERGISFSTATNATFQEKHEKLFPMKTLSAVVWLNNSKHSTYELFH